MSGPSRDQGRRALLEQLRRASEVAGAMEPAGLQPPWCDLLSALRRIPELLEELDVSGQGVELMEKQCDELTDRLTVMESALRSTYEARDDAVLLLAEIREIAMGEAGGGAARDVLAAVRRLREEAVRPRNPPDSGRGRSRNR